MYVLIRNASTSDYSQVVDVIDDWWGGRAMSAMLPRLFFTHFQPWSFVAELDASIVGFLAGFRSQSNPDQVYSHFIGVSPVARGQGVGVSLYQRLFAVASASGCQEVLAVTAPTNRGSIAFHKALGFKIVPGKLELDGISFHPDYDGHGEDRVCFNKAL